jgi:hypothetical protein
MHVLHMTGHVGKVPRAAARPAAVCTVSGRQAKDRERQLER